MLKDQRGIILIVAYLVVMVLLILGSAFIAISINERRIADRERDSIRAFYIAEGGVERALFDLKHDFKFSPGTPSWRDDKVYTSESDITIYIDLSQGGTVSVPQDYPNFYPLPYGTSYCSPPVLTSLGGGSFTVELANVPGKDDEIWIRSTGTFGDATKTIQVYAKVKNYSPWNNAIFAGTGASGTIINGNVDIRGSVHLLGTGLDAEDLAINMSGSANIGNNYQGIPSTLEDKIPELPTVMFNGEMVQSLGAEVRIKNGQAGLNGTATIGNKNSPGDSYKETIDGVYINDGYAGNKGEENVYSDNGTQNSYDLGDAVRFPSLSDPYQGYPTYQEYLRDNALVISDPAQLSELENITPGSNFNYTDGTNTISIDGNGNLTISGIVYIEGGKLRMRKRGPNKTITYSGKGTIFATDDVDIEVNLLTSGPDSFPNNVLGIMTPGDIEFDEANIDVMGAFYAEEEIEVEKQTNIAGTLVSNYFDIGSQVPNIYQVPSLSENLPWGMISLDQVWVIKVIAWQEL